VSLLSLLQSNKDNKDTYFVVFDSFISIL